MREKFIIKPLEHIYDLSAPPLNMNASFADWPSMNVTVDQHRIKKRPGYIADRTVPGIQLTAIYQRTDTTRSTMFLNQSDLMLRESSSGKTYSFKTEQYSTGTISSISGTTVTGSGTSWDTNVAAGDYFIMDDDQTSDEEPDSSWVEIDSVTDATHLELTSNYTKNGTAYQIRKVYTVPTNERWQVAIVDDKFCFTNGNVDVQSWTGTGFASALDSTNAKKARYCIEYANRLVLADLEISGTRNPWTVQWSKENDATDWTDSTAGQVELLRSQDRITGLAKMGGSLLVFKENSIVTANRTGIATSPIVFPRQKVGIGCVAPYSIVHFLDSVAFLGKDDFYIMEGDKPNAIGDRIRYKFFDVVDRDGLANVWGTVYPSRNEVLWFADTTEGQIAFVWDYKDFQWTTYRFWDDITGAGIGAI
jgi:hypothetical protein